MGSRTYVLLSAALIAATLLGQHPIVGQATQAAANASRTATMKSWTPPLAADGHPDLQGNWVNKSATPLERPKELEGRQFLTDAEVAELRSRAERIFANGSSDFPSEDDFFLAALRNAGRYKSTRATSGSEFANEREFDNRTSLIVDPPDGKLPPYTPEGQRRLTASLAAILARNHPANAQDLTSFQRCITYGVPIVRTHAYTSHYQIVQTAGYVVLVNEAIHNARIIPLDGSPHLPQNVRSWNGDSRGRWTGATLVVDTTNFCSNSNFMGSAEDLHLLERFTRVAPDEIRYEITVNDPTTWTRPWTAVLRLKQTAEKIYEDACHEGNQFVVEGMLGGARAEEKAANEAVPKPAK